MILLLWNIYIRKLYFERAGCQCEENWLILNSEQRDL